MTTVGIVGAGQLGQMLGRAGRDLGVDCVFLDPSPEPPARNEGEVLHFEFDDPHGLEILASRADVLTYEFENVPVAALRRLGGAIPVYPPTEALRVAQDRLHEKRLFASLGIPTPEFRNVESLSGLERAVDELGLPIVLKTRRLGYDGKGQAIVRVADERADAWQRLRGVPLIAEPLVPFEREVSAIGARNTAGEIVSYPLTENAHADGILRTSLAPAEDSALYTLAADYHSRLLRHLEYVGVLALEFFVLGDALLANEFAPRVHNSGHWTIEGARTSQFENHLRAVLNLPLGDTAAAGFAAMENLIGQLPRRADEIRAAGFHLHDYGKTPRPGRKLGHVTLVAGSRSARDRDLERLRELLQG